MYLLHETLHYVSSFLPSAGRTGHVFYLPLGMEVSFHDAALPPTGKQIVFHRSPNDIPLSPLVHDTLSTLQHTSGRYLGNTRQDEQSD